MKRVVLALLLFGISPSANAGCYNRIAQCVFVEAAQSVSYKGLCAASACATAFSHSATVTLPNGNGVQIDFARDGKELDPLEMISLSFSGESGSWFSVEVFTGHSESSWFAKRSDGAIYSVIECEEGCESIDPVTFKLLQKNL